MAGDEYQGWTNYETAAVFDWLNTTEEAYRTLDNLANDENFTASEAARALRTWVEAASPLEGQSLYVDLLSHAISRVNWNEIIEAAKEE